MTKFKAGDKVVRTGWFDDELDFMKLGEVYCVEDVDFFGMICVEGDPQRRYFDDGKFDLVRESQSKNMKGVFSNMKFRVNSPEHSKKIQEHLFTLGYKWICETHFVVEKTDKPFLYTEEDGKITYGTNEDYFKNSMHKEHTLQETTSYTLVEKKETLTIDGKTYDKEAVLKRLAELEQLD